MPVPCLSDADGVCNPMVCMLGMHAWYPQFALAGKQLAFHPAGYTSFWLRIDDTDGLVRGFPARFPPFWLSCHGLMLLLILCVNYSRSPFSSFSFSLSDSVPAVLARFSPFWLLCALLCVSVPTTELVFPA